MRIQYTLPGYEPELAPLAQAGEESGPSFEHLMRASPRYDSTTWKQALGLDRIPAGPADLGPPPGSPESRDVATERLRWRHLLSRHLNGEGRSYAPGAQQKVRQMLILLNQAQEAADEVWAHTLDGTGGPR
jgi:hypothetical protein